LMFIAREGSIFNVLEKTQVAQIQPFLFPVLIISSRL